MPDEFVLEVDSGTQVRTRRIDRLIAALAARQHGVVARWQLLRLGLRPRAIAYRIQCGRLHPVHRGVYAVGHRVLSIEGRWMAAVLAGGSGAVLSHRSAAALWGLLRTDRARIEVTVTRRQQPRDGLELHYGRLPQDEVTTVRGIPVTTIARTVLDLAAVGGRRHVERAINEAEFQRLFDLAALARLVERFPRRRGICTVRAVMAERGGAPVTRSELEERFLAFLQRHDLPRPMMNRHVWTRARLVEVDCVWEAQRLIAELDGRAAHATTAAFERDRARDRALTAAGWRVIRITWRQLHDEAETLAADLRAVLGDG